MAKKIFYIILLVLIVYGVWSFVNVTGVKIRYGKLLDQTKNIVKYTSNDPDKKIKRRLKENAEESKLTLTDDDIEIIRFNSDITIRITYADSAVLPFGLKTLYYDQEIDISKGDVEE
ncbi:MAG: hypothetical protein E3J87_02000 [Candidatus Cloacimonadota bacterium]|nr:MAG: hypothetical protein E3J87_02000 [Candidatus Cloacimonadota bacterium]